MKTGVVIYKSRFGAAKQYAQWISDSLNIPAYEEEAMNEVQLNSFDFLIVVTSLYMGSFMMKDWLKNHIDFLKEKKSFLLLVGATPVAEKEKVEEFFGMNIPKEISTQIEHYYVRGKSIHKDLSWQYRLLLKLGAFFTKDPKAKAEMLTEFNDVKKENLQELLVGVERYLKN